MLGTTFEAWSVCLHANVKDWVDFNIKIFDPQIFGVVCVCAPVFENMYFRFFYQISKSDFFVFTA